MEKAFKILVTILSVFLVVSIIASAILIPITKGGKLEINLFSSDKIVDNIKNLEMNMTSIIYVKDEQGNWQEYQRLHGDENRIWVDIEKMPKYLQQAFIAIEDETFYDHSGINWRRTLGAVSNYLFEFDETEFGGSTITQQLIKNITEDKGKNATRKAREICRALLIEQKLKKSQILEAYLNTIALGNGICGVKVAANYYFNKEVEELSLAESATLAAITKNPSRYNPITGFEECLKRRNTVLYKMYQLGMIDWEEYAKAYDTEIVLDDTKEDDLEAEVNSYFVDALIDQVISDLAKKYECNEQTASTMLYNGGFKIYSTVDMRVQNIMEQTYLNKSKYFNLKGKNRSGETVNIQSAMTIMDYSGHIVGIVGGVGEKIVNRGLNRATSAPRQPGSTMKPIGVYALAVENDLIHYTSRVDDNPIENYYPDGKKGPQEWYGYYKGQISVDYAIRKSANTIPVKLLKDLGVEKSYDFLKNKLGLSYLVEEDKNLASLALGGCVYGVTTTESAAAYAIFGNNGVYHNPTTYYKIERVGGEVVLQYDEKGEQVISPATATIMNHLLQGVVSGSEGTGSGIRWYSNMKSYAKTGTSSESNDLWMVAGTPYYVGSVWYGFDMPQQIYSTSGAANIWRDVMKQVHTGLEKKDFVDSDTVYKKGSGYYKVGTTPDSTSSSSGTAKEEEKPTSQPATPTPPATPPADTTTPTTPPADSGSQSGTGGSTNSGNSGSSGGSENSGGQGEGSE